MVLQLVPLKFYILNVPNCLLIFDLICIAIGKLFPFWHKKQRQISKYNWCYFAILIQGKLMAFCIFCIFSLALMICQYSSSSNTYRGENLLLRSLLPDYSVSASFYLDYCPNMWMYFLVLFLRDQQFVDFYSQLGITSCPCYWPLTNKN